MNLAILFLAVCAFLTNEVLSKKVVAELQCDSPIEHTLFGIVSQPKTCRLNKKLKGAFKVHVDADRDGCLENHLTHGVWQGYIYFRVSGGCKMHIKIVRKQGGSEPSPAWGTWSPWSSCSRECKQTRTRTCNSGNGFGCQGDATKTRECSGGNCQNQAPTWGAWTSWSTCSRACQQTRTRTCNSRNGFGCQGDAENTRECLGGNCQVNDDLGECGKANSQNVRVIGGSTAQECEFPWMVLVSAGAPYSTSSNVCGGSIIDNRHILTAAHCVIPEGSTQIYPLSYLTIYSGTSSPFGGRSIGHEVERVFAHRGFTHRTIKMDVAVIRLKEPITYDRCHKPICMFRDNEHIKVQNLQTCRVIGWGRTSNAKGSPVSRNLMWAPQIAASDSQCTYLYGERSGVFCAKGDGRGSCSGDSGGPFACQHSNGRFYQYGIVSAGVTNQCGIRDSLYSDVNYFRTWIRDQVATP